MADFFGIYGYSFTKAFRCNNLSFEPLFTSLNDVREKASDGEVFHQTGVLEVAGGPGTEQLLFDLEAILSLIDHRMVIVRGLSKDREAARTRFPKEITLHKRPNGGGALIFEDAFFPNSRSKFVQMAMNFIATPSSGTRAFKQCVHKCVACFRMPIPYVDVTYYLLFSGLEALARETENDFGPSAAPPITRFLEKQGFDVAQDDFVDELRSITNYCHVRNALFHNGHFERQIIENGVAKTLKLARFFGRLRSLVPLSILKHVGFDDGHINWNSWRDRMPFK